MTTEEQEYEGTPELIYYCEYDPEAELAKDSSNRLELTFTNEYEVQADFSHDEENKVVINLDIKPKKSRLPKNFFGDNILNVTAIAGRNGVGKTFLLGEFSQNKRVKENNFFIYKSLDGSKFYINNFEKYLANVDIGTLDEEKIKDEKIYIIL